MSKTMRHDNLDGVKVLLAFFVVFGHVLANGNYNVPDWYDIIFRGTKYVCMFFVISAFGMCCGYYTKIGEGLINPELFYEKRIRKLLPFFALICSLDLGMAILTHTVSVKNVADYLTNLTLQFGFLSNENMTVIGVGWTLGVIFAFYIYFPFFVYTIENNKRAIAAFVTSVIITILCQRIYPNTCAFVVNLPYFYAGGLTYLNQEKITVLVKKIKPLIFVICAGITVCWNIAHWRQSFQKIGGVSLGFIENIILFFVWLCFFISDNLKLFSNRIMKFISGISFEIYLCHMVMYRILEKMNLIHLTSIGVVDAATTSVTVFGMAGVFSFIAKKIIDRAFLQYV